MDLVIARTLGLLLVATMVAIMARRVSLPYTVGLVVAGAALTFLRVDSGIALTHDIVFDVLLPPLLFEAALNLHWNNLRRDIFPVLVLSIAGVIVSAAVVAAGMFELMGWPLSSALVFGILIAATDPVAVIAMFKDAGIESRIRLLVESESLFNDGVAAVLFGIAIAGTQNASQSPLLIGLSVITTAGGGIAVGLITGAAGLLLAGRTSDHVIEAAVTGIAAYGAFFVADHVHVSGVLATVSAGLLMGNVGIRGVTRNWGLSKQGCEYVLELWDFAAFLANSIVFLLIGITAARVPFSTLGFASLSTAILLILLGRAATVYPISWLFARSRWRIAVPDQHVLWWGGLRGALALALALALPPSTPLRNSIVIVTFVVVAFSVLIQGLTMKPLLTRLHERGH
jgi:CPA1 family monovalent cation:H+ antiporter